MICDGHIPCARNAHRPIKKRRHRELFVVAAVLFVLGAVVLDGLALFASLIAFYLGIMHRLSGEDVSKVEGSGFIGLGG